MLVMAVMIWVVVFEVCGNGGDTGDVFGGGY